MYQDLIDDEVLSDTQSSASSSRRNSLISSYMATPVNTRSRRGSIIARQSSTIDPNETKSIIKNQTSSVKVLSFNGKCSEIFKSTLEDCVEDCILEFPGQNPIYVPKSEQKSKRDSTSSLPQSIRSNRRRSSITQFNLPYMNELRSSQVNNITLSTAALAATSTARMRPKYSFVEDITEESSQDYQSILEEQTATNGIESEQQQQQHIIQEERANSAVSLSVSPSRRKATSSTRPYSSYRSRQKDFRLSDLVMHGPEYYANIFNLPRTSRYSTQTTLRQNSNPQQQRNKKEDKYTELDRIKQDLFHRYLWTQKPQVSCRIRPVSTYTRSTTFVL